MKMLKATISGSYKTSDKRIESFDRVTGYLPKLDDDKAQQMIIKRYAPIWVPSTMRTDAKGNELDEVKFKGFRAIRQVFVDSIEEVEVEEEFSYIGKDIMELDAEELQDLAAANDLSDVPLIRTGSLTSARRIAFAAYANNVLGWTETRMVKGKMQEAPLDWRVEGFNPSKYEAIIVDGVIRRSGQKAALIEETLDNEHLAMKTPGSKPQSRLTLDQLKAIAKERGISYNGNIGYEALHKKIYADAA